MYERAESEYFTAKRKAAARLGVSSRHLNDLPSNREIRDQVQALAVLLEGDKRHRHLRDMRIAALRMMRLLSEFNPRLIGSVLTGHIRNGSDIDLHVFAAGSSSVADKLQDNGYSFDVEHKRVIKHNVERVFTHVHVQAEFPFELTVYRPEQLNYVFKSSITGKAMERSTIAELEALIMEEHPDAFGLPESEVAAIWLDLLRPLESVKQNPRYHPEGDALYHSLQAFELARDAAPYDVELMTAALLHDVGKGIDSRRHVEAGLEALSGTLSAREHFLIAHHMDAQEIAEGGGGQKLRRRLQASEWFEDLMLLREIDRGARVPGMEVVETEEAIAFILELRMEADAAGE